MESFQSFFAGIDWQAYVLVGIGLVIGALLKELGKDLYGRVSKRFFRQPDSEKPTQLVVQIAPGSSGVGAPSTAKLSPASVERISQISYEDIIRAVDAAPPMQQENVRKSFVGIRVEWDVLFRGGEEEGDKFALWLRWNSESIGLIRCRVSAADYPELKVLPQNAPVRIIGTIRSVTELSVVELTDVRLEILAK